VVRGTLLQSLLQNQSFFGTLSKAKNTFITICHSEQSEEQTIPFLSR
jgi:hypothetical protein